jgi:hypothetical protein
VPVITADEVLAYMGLEDSAGAEETFLAESVRGRAEALVTEFVGGVVLQKTCVDVLPPYGRDVDPESNVIGWDRSGGKAVALTSEARQVLRLTRTPVRSVVEVRETWVPGGGGFPAGSVVDPALYFLDVEEADAGLSRSGLLIKPYYVWSGAARSVRVTYLAGYTPAELDLETGIVPELKEAMLLTAARAVRTVLALHDQQFGFSGVGPVISEGLGGANFAYDMEGARTLVGQVCSLTPEVKEMVRHHKNYSHYL